jgi:hypothetical protein
MRKILFILFLGSFALAFPQKDSLRAKHKNRVYNFSRHYIGLDLSPARYSTVALNYVFIFPSGSFGIKTNLLYNLSPETYQVAYATKLSRGFSNSWKMPRFQKYAAVTSANFFPARQQKRFSYYFGLSCQVSAYDYSYADPEKLREYGWCFTGQINNTSGQDIFVNGRQSFGFALALNNGLLIRINKYIFCDLQLSFGREQISFENAGNYFGLWCATQCTSVSVFHERRINPAVSIRFTDPGVL